MHIYPFATSQQSSYDEPACLDIIALHSEGQIYHSPDSILAPTLPTPAHLQEPRSSGVVTASARRSKKDLLSAKSNTALCRFSVGDDYGNQIFEEARRCTVNSIALGREEAMIRVYSPSPVYHTPAHPRHRGTIEYHPEPQLYAYKPPPEDVDSIDMILKRDQAYREWTRQSETIASLLASSPSIAIKAWPACIWKAVDENVHILYSTPRYQLQVDDRIICCGLLEEVWRLTDRMERKHDTSRREPVEWVYIICQNDQTHQETWSRGFFGTISQTVSTQLILIDNKMRKNLRIRTGS
ncbi:hypothetical protein B0H14DRAFT_2598247 [Mycena olivaceomarginata]|nr:hypothetical protein B0H14DRAFT_2598247 [Mycena olivaceomarginata]